MMRLAALAIAYSPERARTTLVAFFQALTEALLILVRWIILVAPAGVFALLLPLAADRHLFVLVHVRAGEEVSAATSPEQPWPVRTVARKIAEYVDRLGAVWVEGQLTQVSARPGAGTAFLVLRDPAADVSLTLTCAAVLSRDLLEGSRVVVHGRPSFFVGRGTLSLRVDEIRAVGVGELLARVEREGLNRSKIQVLEALLRLRQAACHPGLIDKERTGDPSAKLDVLLPSLLEVTEEGHKCLVFSQFTSFLAIVRERLDEEKVPYLYLDGRTRDRAARVAQFQSDPESKLFLISLKAGGLGLNLTAAEYVFLLDPWWNPAVEAQAIDRTHRIGQTRPVFAYRLIARDTVEEKVLELQKSKRDLADAIINADNSLIRNLGREDLELLLS